MSGASDGLAQELRVLRALPGVKYVGDFPAGRAVSDLNKIGVKMMFPGGLDVPHDSEAKLRQISVHCSANVPDKLAAALAMKGKLAVVLGAAAIAAAQQLVLDEVAAEASAGASASAPPTAFSVLGATQRLQSQLRAADLRAQAAERAAVIAEEEAARSAVLHVAGPEAARKDAWASLEAARDALATHTKKQRAEATTAPAPATEPAWRSRLYADYQLEMWRQEEGKVYNRRREPLTDKPSRPAAELRRGEFGPLDHWRRGLVGAVQDWAAGSRADAAMMIYALIQRLELGDALREKLHVQTTRDNETDSFIVDRVKSALDVLKVTHPVHTLVIRLCAELPHVPSVWSPSLHSRLIFTAPFLYSHLSHSTPPSPSYRCVPPSSSARSISPHSRSWRRRVPPRAIRLA
jgi:hypothetical protein